jgi:hypothetical protein
MQSHRWLYLLLGLIGLATLRNGGGVMLFLAMLTPLTAAQRVHNRTAVV